MKKNSDKIFLSMLRAALTDTEPTVLPSSSEEWQELLKESKRQGVIGIVWQAVERYQKLLCEREPEASVSSIRERTGGEGPFLLIRYIEDCNKRLDFTCQKVIHNFALDGIRVCILKGQAFAQLYPQPLRRQPGDVDVWLEGGEPVVKAYVKKYFRQPVEHSWYHSSLTLKNGVELELHNAPGHSDNHRYDAELQTFFNAHAPWCEDGSGVFRKVPKEGEKDEFLIFNSVYLVTHIFTHMRAEGIGMKQVLDLYWLMRKFPSPIDSIPKNVFNHISHLYSALAWLYLQLGMPQENLWVKPDRRRGKLLLREILSTGVVSGEDITEKRHKMSSFYMIVHRFIHAVKIYPLLGAEPFYKLYAQITWHILHPLHLK